MGIKKTTDIDCFIWGQRGEIEARRLKKVFDIEREDVIEGFVRALNMATLFLFFYYKVKQTLSKEAVLKATSCLMQKGIKSGRGIFECRPVKENFLKIFL